MFGNDRELLSQPAQPGEREAEDLLWALESLASTSGTCADGRIDTGIHLTDDRAERIRWNVVGLRDRGEVKRAEQLFAFLHRHWPAFDGFLTEFLVINVLFDPHPDRVRPIAQSFLGMDHVPSQIALLLSLDAARAEDMETARHFWGYVNQEAERVGPFKEIYRDILSAINHAALPAEERLVAFLEYSASVGNLHKAIRETAFFNSFALQDPVGSTSTALLAAQPSFDAEALAHSMAFFSATRQDAEVDQIFTQLERDPLAWSIPQFAKWTCLHAIRTGDRAREKEVLLRYQAGASKQDNLSPLSIAAAQDEELRARSATTPVATQAQKSDGEKTRIFIGIFGQLRYYQHTLPLLIDYLKNDLADDYDMNFGLATWSKVGARPLSIQDSIDFYKDLMPVDLLEIVEKSGVQDGVSLRRILPNITQRMMELSTDIAIKPVSIDEIGAYLPTDSKIRIDEDAWFQAEIIRHLPERLPDSASRYLTGNLNQLRMWSRIAALGELAREYETLSGGHFDQVILIRSDLILRAGSLSTLLSEAKSQNYSVISDFDPHAEYIEGIGDRFFIAGRDAIEPLFDCFESLLDRIRTCSPSLIRLNPHEGASSVLFSGGRNALTKANIFYEIHRGRFPLGDVQEAVAADARLVRKEGLRSQLENLMCQNA